MKKIEFLFRVFSTVTVCVVTAVALFTTVINPADSMSPATLWQILLVSFLCTLGSLIHPWRRTPGKIEMGIRILLHYLWVNLIVLGAGLRFCWYRTDHLSSVLSMELSITVIFVIATVIEMTKSFREAKRMNEKLKEYIENKENREDTFFDQGSSDYAD